MKTSEDKTVKNANEEPSNSPGKTIKTKLVETFAKKSNTAKFLKEKSHSLERQYVPDDQTEKMVGEVKIKKPLRKGRSRSLFCLEKVTESRLDETYIYKLKFQGGTLRRAGSLHSDM